MTLSRQSGRLVQLSRRAFDQRIPSGQKPDMVELRLAEHERVVSVELRQWHQYSDRKTCDWTITVWIEVRL